MTNKDKEFTPVTGADIVKKIKPEGNPHCFRHYCYIAIATLSTLKGLFLVQDSHCIRSNHQFFISRDYYNFHLRIFSRNHCFFATNLVLLQIQLHAHVFQTFACTGTTRSLVLAYTTGKYDDVYATQSSSISTDILLIR